MKSVALFAAAAVAALLAAPPAAAMLIVPVTDEHLVETSTAAVEARVLSVDSGPAGNPPSTDYLLEIDRLVAGELPGRHVILRLPGGEVPGQDLLLYIEGVPRFAVGERLFLFLDPSDDGTFHPRHLMQGAFRERMVGGERLLIRDLGQAVALPPLDEPAATLERFFRGRDAAGFSRWVADRARGVAREPDYFVPLPEAVGGSGDTTSGLGSVTGEYRLFKYGPTGLALRWFAFDDGQSVDWRIFGGGEPGYGEAATAKAASAAIGAWNGLRGVGIRYRYAGTTKAGGGLTSTDGVNGILFDDADGSLKSAFSCATGGGGTLAHAGPWVGLTQTAPDGTRYHRTVEADVVTNSNIDCYLERYAGSLDQLLAHELGHTLGIHHPCDSDETSSRPCSRATTSEVDSVMYPYLHNDTRGARLNEDDRAAARALYPRGSGPSGPPPAAPSELTAEVRSASTVFLTWSDNSTDETLFRVEARPAGGAWTVVATPAANEESALVVGLTPATAYSLRAQARNANGGSAYSNTAFVLTQLPVPAAPQALAAEVVSPTAVRLTWGPPAGGGQGFFRVESRTPWSPVWLTAVDTAPDATSVTVGDLVTGLPVSFRVLAVNQEGLSAPSIVASATPHANAGACTAGGEVLCLKDRFAVRVHWSSYADGLTGLGGAAPFGGGESGSFWFFDPSNVELIVKLLDGTSLNDHYWVFHAALSDVEYWISVLDTATGSSRTYYNEPHDSCGAFDTLALPRGEAAVPARPAAAAATGGDEELVLMEGRFRLRVEWVSEHAASRTGVGYAVDGGSQSGYFWFFSPSNIEVAAKVLDGRPLNGHFWVFFASLSDVEYDLVVTDTHTGQSKTFHNPAGSTCGQFDARAFPLPF
jgi:hypothetical protein